MTCLTTRTLLGWPPALLFCLFATPAQAQLQITVSAGSAGGSLEIRVSNEGEDPVSLPMDHLPWAIPSRNFNLVVVPADPVAEPLTRLPLWDEPIEAPAVEIQPGEVRTGKLSLGSLFDGYAQAHRENDLLVFWSWHQAPEAASSNGRGGGWLLIPQTTRGKEP
jgi:hypothetical protein